MSEQYTPTTADIQASLVFLNIEHAIRNSDDPDTITIQKEVNAQFNRWLAKRDAEVAAKAWEEGHSAGEENAGIGMASLLTGLPAPEAKPNPYRKEVES